MVFGRKWGLQYLQLTTFPFTASRALITNLLSLLAMRSLQSLIQNVVAKFSPLPVILMPMMATKCFLNQIHPCQRFLVQAVAHTESFPPTSKPYLAKLFVPARIRDSWGLAPVFCRICERERQFSRTGPGQRFQDTQE